MWFASTIVFLQLSPATSIGILYIDNTNFKLNKKVITHKFRINGKIILKIKPIDVHWERVSMKWGLFFCILCGRGDSYTTAWG